MTTTKANQDIRDRMKRCGLFLWQLANKCNITEGTMVRWLRQELPKEDSRRVLIEKVLDELERSD